MKETDLYGPVRDFLLSRGYTVRSEVRGCDITAIKGDDLVILEMKTALTVPLLAQAVERQKAADSVYVVVPHPGKRVRTREWRRTCALLKRLELGLVLVTLDGSNPEVEIPFHPAVRTIRKRREPPTVTWWSVIVSKRFPSRAPTTEVLRLRETVRHEAGTL